jgi:hypothetical protein
MRCDSRASLLAHTLASPYLGCKPKTMVTTLISMDIIMDLPQSNSFDSILVVVDYLMKMVHFVHCNKSIIGENTMELFFDHVFHYHGFLEDIISNHGP